jgi:AraC-like DNA-binding protein
MSTLFMPYALRLSLSQTRGLCQSGSSGQLPYCFGSSAGSESEGSANTFIQQVICEAIKWIDDHLQDRLSVAIVADRSGYTRWYFQRKFHQLTGLTVLDYIQIAQNHGFSDNNQLSRAIQKYLGMTVTELRMKGGSSGTDAALGADGQVKQ